MSMVGAQAAVTTVVVILGRTKQKLKEVGAFTPDTALTPSELGLAERWLKMSAIAGVVATKDGRYYLETK